MLPIGEYLEVREQVPVAIRTRQNVFYSVRRTLHARVVTGLTICFRLFWILIELAGVADASSDRRHVGRIDVLLLQPIPGDFRKPRVVHHVLAAAVQIAKAMGATVIATAGTRQKLDVAKSFGADYGVDYRDESWPQKVLELTPKKRGVDIVYDPVGLIEKSTKCIAWNGRLLVIGFAGGPIEKMATNRILLKNVSVVGLHWGAYAVNEPEMQDVVWEGIFKLVREGKFR